MKKLTTQEVEPQFRKIHGDKYTYDWTTYVNNSTKMKIICKEHGEFLQSPNSHKQGNGCQKCVIKNRKNHHYSFENIQEKQRKFIFDCNEKHNHFYDYSMVNYKNALTNVKIICPIHGEFWQQPNNHKNGSGCFECGQILKYKKLMYTKSDFIKLFSNKYKFLNDSYDFSCSNYINLATKIDIYCKECNRYFNKTPDKLLTGNLCPTCKIKSVGFENIKYYLNYGRYEYITEKTFDNCAYKNKLRFDFYLPELNVCIEFDGEQHFIFPNYYHKTKQDFKDKQLRDKIKTEYCEKNNIKLIRIPYWDKDNITEILNKELLCQYQDR